MKYCVSVTEEYGAVVENLMRMNRNSRIYADFGSGQIMMVARARFDTGETSCLLLKEGNVLDFVREMIDAWKARTDCVRFGWPKNLVVTEG